METSAQDGLRETGSGNNSLEKILKILFPGREWLHNKQMKTISRFLLLVKNHLDRILDAMSSK